MPTVVFTQNLRRHINLERMDVGGGTVKDVLAQVFEQIPTLTQLPAGRYGCRPQAYCFADQRGVHH